MLEWGYVFSFSIGVMVGMSINVLISYIANYKDRVLKEKKSYYKHPCNNCINFDTCKTGCELLEYDEEKLLDLFMKYTCCPDCGNKTLYEGPAGGCSVNVKCSNCEHYFNLALPMFAQRIHINPQTKEFKKGW